MLGGYRCKNIMTEVADLLGGRTPDFSNLEAVLKGEVPSRPTLFEFHLNENLYQKLGGEVNEKNPLLRIHLRRLFAHRNAGYDYGMLLLDDFEFVSGEKDELSSVSINEGGVITSREDFESYPWPDLDRIKFSIVDDLAEHLPVGMKWIPFGPYGLEENVIRLVGYEDLCYMMADEPDLVGDIFDAVGSRLLGYYLRMASHPTVGACMVNDDWGFKTGTLLSLDQMREYVFPWHKKMVEAIHGKGKFALLHSCGYFGEITEELFSLGYDGRHSYEDAITPVEEAYEKYHDRFAILGGIDVDFLCRSSPEDVYARASKLLEKGMDSGGYALGSGNSIADYVPEENYFSMLKAALK
jgi:uroporphyrinogen decarboxylase